MVVVCCFWFSICSLRLALHHLACFFGFFGLAALLLPDIYKYRRPLVVFLFSFSWTCLPPILISALLCYGQNQFPPSTYLYHSSQAQGSFLSPSYFLTMSDVASHYSHLCLGMTFELAAWGISRSFYVLVYTAVVVCYNIINPISSIGLGFVNIIMTSDTTSVPF